MARDILHVGDVGIPILVQVIDRVTKQPVDLTDFVSGFVRLKKPGTAPTNKAAVLHDGPNGWIKYITVGGDIDTPGPWKAQAYQVTTTGDGPWSGDEDEFLVRANLS
ncbi:MAG: hypothetical protein ABI634_02715 [Acidobacteriota bacterium]